MFCSIFLFAFHDLDLARRIGRDHSWGFIAFYAKSFACLNFTLFIFLYLLFRLLEISDSSFSMWESG